MRQGRGFQSVRNEVNMYVHYNNSYICMNCLKLNEKKTTSGRFGTVHLWLELCKIITFGFESKNGHLKHLFHSHSNIVDQLVFNVDLQLTLQLLHPILLQKESPETLDYLMTTNGSAPRRGMPASEETHLHCG